jgi:pyrroline-5-carboxylate reductase
MVLEGEESPEQLRINVCSPNGTTLKAVDVLMEKDFRGIIEEAFDAAVARSKEMSGE